MDKIPVYSNLEESHRDAYIWKPFRDQLDVRCEHILERCQNTTKRLQTITCSDILAEMGATMMRRGEPVSECDSAIDLDVPEYCIESSSAERSFADPSRGSSGGDVRQPRTSSPIEYNSEGLTEHERREVWRNRVLSKKPILFRTYGSTQRHPRKSYREDRRHLQGRKWPRRVLIDSPRFRTPTPKALRVSWSCMEDVLKQEGILSSPVRLHLLGTEDESPTPCDVEVCEVMPFDEESPIDAVPVYNNNNEDGPCNLSCTSSSSDSQYKVLQQEIIDKVHRDMAAQTPVSAGSLMSPRSSRRRSRGFVSVRTSRRKLAIKKAKVLNPRSRSFLTPSPEPDEPSPSTPSRQFHRYRRNPCKISPNFNRNATVVRPDTQPLPENVNEDMPFKPTDTKTKITAQPLSDDADEDMSFKPMDTKEKITVLCTFDEPESVGHGVPDRPKTSTDLPIPALASSRRNALDHRGSKQHHEELLLGDVHGGHEEPDKPNVSTDLPIPTLTSSRRNASNHRGFKHREELFSGDVNGRGEERNLTKSASNPNLIVIVPKEKPSNELKRSYSNPDLSISLEDAMAYPAGVEATNDVGNGREKTEENADMAASNHLSKVDSNAPETQLTNEKTTNQTTQRKSPVEGSEVAQQNDEEIVGLPTASQTNEVRPIEPLMNKSFYLQSNGSYTHKRPPGITRAMIDEGYKQRFDPSFRGYRVNDAHHYYRDGTDARGADGHVPRTLTRRKSRKPRIYGVNKARDQPYVPAPREEQKNLNTAQRNNGENTNPTIPANIRRDGIAGDNGGNNQALQQLNNGPPGPPHPQPQPLLQPPPTMNGLYGQSPATFNFVRPPPGFNVPPRGFMRVPPPMFHRLPLLPVPMRYHRLPMNQFPIFPLPPPRVLHPGMMPQLRMIPPRFPLGSFPARMPGNPLLRN